MCGSIPEGVIRKGVFGTRNLGKHSAVNTAIGALQWNSVADSVANSASIFGEGLSGAASNALEFVDKGILKATDAIGCSDAAKALSASEGTKSIIGAVANKAVNPLLCVAAGVRILNDDNQYSALIEEGSAMGLMFGTEKLMKTGTKKFYEIAEKGASNVLKEISESSGIKKTLTDTIKKAAKGFSKLTSGQKTLAKIGIDLLFVAGSIGAYTLGKNIGKKITGRDEAAQSTAET